MRKKLIFLFKTLLVCVLAFSLSTSPVMALTWDGASSSNGAGGEGAAGTFGISYSDATKASGYRFSVVNSSGSVQKGPVDVFRYATNTSHINRSKLAVKYAKSVLKNVYSGASFSTTTSTAGCNYDTNLGLELPATTTEMEAWCDSYANLNKLFSAAGWAMTVDTCDANGWSVLVEPIFAVKLNGENCAFTVTEIAAYGASVYGANNYVGASASTNSWENISEYTNRYWPNSLRAENGYGLFTAAPALSTYKTSFKTIIEYGYGVAILYGKNLEKKYYLDVVNGVLDGNKTDTLENYGTVDVYINGSLVADDVTDFYNSYPSGTTYEITDIKPTTGHSSQGVWSGQPFALSGTITQDIVGWLEFNTNSYYLDVNAVLDNELFSGTGDYGTFDVYINGSLVADDVTDYCEPIPHGATYEIKGIKATAGHSYQGVQNDISGIENNTGYAWAYTSPASGTMTSPVYPFLKFETNTDANVFTIQYDGNGATSGEGWLESFSVTNNTSYTLSSNTSAFSRAENIEATGVTTLFKFVGWTIGGTTYDFGEEISSDVLFENVKTSDDEKNSIVTVYATWDEYPIINAVDRRFSLDEAQEGKITWEELFKTADAVDGEIGSITDFKNGEGSFTIVNFDKDKLTDNFKKFTSNGSVTVTYKAVDNAGNETYRTITVYIVDKENVFSNTGSVVCYTRFVGPQYYKNSDGSYIAEADGGLNSGSSWINIFEYEKALTETLSNKIDATTGEWEKVHQTWIFSKNQIAEVKAYVEEHGLGNSQESDALANFYSLYVPEQ